MKRISRRNFLKAMGISATALTLAACGGSSSSTAASTAGSSAASAAATGEPKAGGTLRLCYTSPIATPGYTPPCRRQRRNLLPDPFLRESGQLR